MLIALSGEMMHKRQVVCLGEPHFNYSMRALLAFCREIGLQVDKSWEHDVNTPLTAKRYFTWLGFASCLSLDYSDYEGAEIIHNLNEPDLAKEHHAIADLIVDAGTIEHVFHLPPSLHIDSKTASTAYINLNTWARVYINRVCLIKRRGLCL